MPGLEAAPAMPSRGQRPGAGIEVRLEHRAARIADAAAPDVVRRAQTVRWLEDLEDLMHDQPEVEAGLRTLVDTIRQQLSPIHQQSIRRIEARAVGPQRPGRETIVHHDRDTPPTGDGR